jgi:hypothetical protein
LIRGVRSCAPTHINRNRSVIHIRLAPQITGCRKSGSKYLVGYKLNWREKCFYIDDDATDRNQ